MISDVEAQAQFPKLERGYGLVVRPATVYGWTGNGSQVLGGPSKDPPVGYGAGDFGRIKWKRWTMKRARGSGVLWRNSCRPYCGNGSWSGTPVKVVAYRVRHARFTRMRFTCSCRNYDGVEVLAYRGRLPPQWRAVR